MQKIDSAEIDGRIAQLERQRNSALNEVCIVSGKLAVALQEVSDLKNQIKEDLLDKAEDPSEQSE
jgi:hypothetical protein